MKVLIVTAMWPTAENPASGAFVRSQVESLERAGAEVSVLVLSGARRKLAYALGALRLHSLLRRNPFDVVHAHYSFAGVVARTQFRVPVIVTFHGDDLLGTIGPNGKPTRQSAFNVALGKRLARFVDEVIVVNAEMARRLAPVAAHIIPGELDLSVFAPCDQAHARRQLGLAPERKYLLFAADPAIPVKRFSLAEAVMRELDSIRPAPELLVVSRESQERLSLFMNACDALLFPSYQEGSPTIVKQAMACNLPIVATDVGDVRHLIGSTRGCHICAPSAAAFAAAVREILQDGRRTNGRDAVRHLDGAQIAGRVLRVYESALRTQPRALASRLS